MNEIDSDTEAVWLDLIAAGQRLGVSHWTVRRWVAAGKLPARRLPNGAIRIRATDVDAVGETVNTAKKVSE